MAVLIGVRAATFVTKELNLNIEKRLLWTDSQCFALAQNEETIACCRKQDQGNTVSEEHIILLHCLWSESI